MKDGNKDFSKFLLRKRKGLFEKEDFEADRETLLQWFAQGRIGPMDEIWDPDSREWQYARYCDHLFKSWEVQSSFMVNSYVDCTVAVFEDYMKNNSCSDIAKRINAREDIVRRELLFLFWYFALSSVNCASQDSDFKKAFLDVFLDKYLSYIKNSFPETSHIEHFNDRFDEYANIWEKSFHSSGINNDPEKQIVMQFIKNCGSKPSAFKTADVMIEHLYFSEILVPSIKEMSNVYCSTRRSWRKIAQK